MMGKEYGPPKNKLLAIFVDDMSIAFVNKWGDQVTLEIVRQLIEQGGFYWLDKAQRGNFKSIKNLSYAGAMNHLGGGRNDSQPSIATIFHLQHDPASLYRMYLRPYHPLPVQAGR